MKIITNQIVRNLNISPKNCVSWVKESFSIKSLAQLPAKISVHPADNDFFTSMPCLLPENSKGERFFGIKEVHRLEGSVPSLGSDMMLYDAKNGTLLAIIDCDWITTMRTGAVAALSANVLRKRDADTYGFIGLGNTARATLLCALEYEPSKSFHVKLLKYKNQAELFIDRFQQYKNVTFEVVDGLKELISSVDVLFSCITDANGLFVDDESLYPSGITIIPVHMRGFQNCDVSFDRVFGDDTDHVKGFKYFSQFKDYDEIGNVILGLALGRKNDNQRIIDYNYGLALHDVLYASKIYNLVEDMCLFDVDYDKEQKKFWV